MSPRRSTEMRVPTWSVALTIAVSFSVWACASAATQAPTASPTQPAQETPTSEPAGTPTPTAAGGLTEVRDLLTEEEVAAVLGEAILKASAGGFEYRGVQVTEGWDFSGVQGGFLQVALVTNGKEQFEQARAQWSDAVDVAGLGDEAFAVDGGSRVIMAAREGTTAVWLYASTLGPDWTESLKSLMATALSRI